MRRYDPEVLEGRGQLVGDMLKTQRRSQGYSIPLVARVVTERVPRSLFDPEESPTMWDTTRNLAAAWIREYEDGSDMWKLVYQEQPHGPSPLEHVQRITELSLVVGLLRPQRDELRRAIGTMKHTIGFKLPPGRYPISVEYGPEQRPDAETLRAAEDTVWRLADPPHDLDVAQLAPLRRQLARRRL